VCKDTRGKYKIKQLVSEEQEKARDEPEPDNKTELPFHERAARPDQPALARFPGRIGREGMGKPKRPGPPPERTGHSRWRTRLEFLGPSCAAR